MNAVLPVHWLIALVCLAGYGETYGENHVLSAFQNYLDYKDLNASQLKVKNGDVSDFIDFLTNQTQPSDDEDSGEPVPAQHELFLLPVLEFLQSTVISVGHQQNCTHATGCRTSCRHLDHDHLTKYLYVFTASSRSEAEHDVVEVLASSEEEANSMEQSVTDQVGPCPSTLAHYFDRTQHQHTKAVPAAMQLATLLQDSESTEEIECSSDDEGVSPGFLPSATNGRTATLVSCGNFQAPAWTDVWQPDSTASKAHR